MKEKTKTNGEHQKKKTQTNFEIERNETKEFIVQEMRNNRITWAAAWSVQNSENRVKNEETDAWNRIQMNIFSFYSSRQLFSIWRQQP